MATSVLVSSLMAYLTLRFRGAGEGGGEPPVKERPGRGESQAGVTKLAKPDRASTRAGQSSRAGLSQRPGLVKRCLVEIAALGTAGCEACSGKAAGLDGEPGDGQPLPQGDETGAAQFRSDCLQSHCHGPTATAPCLLASGSPWPSEGWPWAAGGARGTTGRPRLAPSHVRACACGSLTGQTCPLRASGGACTSQRAWAWLGTASSGGAQQCLAGIAREVAGGFLEPVLCRRRNSAAFQAS